MRGILLGAISLGMSLIGGAVIAQQPPHKPPHKQQKQNTNTPPRRNTGGAQPAQNAPGRAAQGERTPSTPASPQPNAPIQNQPLRGVAGGVAPQVHRADGHTPEEIAARDYLKMMLKPSSDYVGVRETVEQTGASSTTSLQDVEGDTRGNLLITFRSPLKDVGDVMLISPNAFRSYHKARNEEEIAIWPTEWNDEGKRLFTALQNHSVVARNTGQELVAGRMANIVVLSPINAAGVEGPPLRRFWIDQATGIQLKIQKLRANGTVTSTTTMKEITLASVNPQDFKLPFKGATSVPLFPSEGQSFYHTLQEAQGHLPLQPMIPTTLPSGYELDGIWSFGERAQPRLRSVLLRFTNGVASFSLFQHFALAKNAAEQALVHHNKQSFARGQQHWVLNTPQGLIGIEYIGHLRGDEVESLYNSLQ